MRIIVASLSLLAVLAIATGCAKKEASSTTSPPAAATNEPSAPPPSAEHVPEQGEQISTEGSAAEIMARADHEEAELEKIIRNAQLNVVHQKAFAIRDLAAAAAGKATVSGENKAKLDEHVARIKSLASELDEAGDAGNLGKTKAEFADLQAELLAVRQIIGVHR